MNKHNDLYTLEFDNLNKNCPLSEYPFPQFKRDSYVCLNGIWKHKTTKNINDLSNINEDILVPFPIESNASGVQKRLQKGEYIIYKKEFSILLFLVYISQYSSKVLMKDILKTLNIQQQWKQYL